MYQMLRIRNTAASNIYSTSSVSWEFGVSKLCLSAEQVHKERVSKSSVRLGLFYLLKILTVCNMQTAQVKQLKWYWYL